MEPWLSERFGNPSGPHGAARAARQAIDEAREVVADLLGVGPGGVVFTSGGTEADNLAVLGRARACPRPLVVSALEHHAVLRAAEVAAEVLGVEVRTVRAGRDGVVDLESLEAALGDDVGLVSVQLVNNEVGTVQPLEAVARLVRRHAPRAVLHTDAVQAAPWFDLAEAARVADLVTVSAHKFGGPQGTGALALRSPVELAPLVVGGPQERELRAGTHNVAGIVGMAAAFQAAAAERPVAGPRVSALRDRLVSGLLSRLSGARETAPGAQKAPGHCHLVLDDVESEALLVLLDRLGVAASAGSACASGAIEPSHVLLAMGFSPKEALGALRLTLGHTSSPADVDLALEAVPQAVSQLGGGPAGAPRPAGAGLAAAHAQAAPGGP